MVGKNNRVLKVSKQGTKIESYSIKKFKVGAASVVIGASIFFGAGVAAASEDVANNTTDANTTNASTESVVVQEETPKEIAAPKVETKEASAEEVAAAVKTKTQAIDKTTLQANIARLEAALSVVDEAKVGSSTLASAKVALENAKATLANDVATEQEVATQVKRTGEQAYVVESMPKEGEVKKEVKKGANTIANSGKNDPRNGQKMGEGVSLRSNFTLEESGGVINKNNATGTDTYKVDGLQTETKDGNTSAADWTGVASGKDEAAVKAELDKFKQKAKGLEFKIYSNQRDGEEENPANGGTTINGGAEGHNNKGRIDYPLTPEMAKALAKEGILWRGKLRPDGSTVSTKPVDDFKAGGGYEFLVAEIYKLAYEQGIDKVYIPEFSKRIELTDTAKQAGWTLEGVTPTNLPAGLVYDKDTDSIQGIIRGGQPILSTAALENGVMDFRADVVFKNTTTNETVTIKMQNMRFGFIAWQDTTPPTLGIDEAVYNKKVGDNLDVNIKYDDASSSTDSNATATRYAHNAFVPYELEGGNGRTVDIRNKQTPAIIGVGKANNANGAGVIVDETQVGIPGATYKSGNPAESRKLAEPGKISGELTEAGIFTIPVYAKDWNQLDNQHGGWIQSGQEARASITVNSAPKVVVKNIETYSKEVPMTISKGASSATVTMPDGSNIELEVRDGQWYVKGQSTSLGAEGSEIRVPVTEEQTAKAGIDNIKVVAQTENVKAMFMRDYVDLNVEGTNEKARIVFDPKSGHWEFPENEREVTVVKADGGKTVTNKRVYTAIEGDGKIVFYVYQYVRTYDNAGNVTSVDSVTRTRTEYVAGNTINTKDGNGMIVTVTYDKVNGWKASDGSTVTATELGDNGWTVETSSGFRGKVNGKLVIGDEDRATIINTKPTASSKDYESTLNAKVDLRNATEAAVVISDTEDAKYNKTTYITRLTVTSPSGAQKVYSDKTDAANYELAKDYALTEVGVYTVDVEVIDSNGNIVTAELNGTDAGTDSGAGSSVAKTTYHITVKPLAIEGNNKTSKNIQGAVQKETPTFNFADTDKTVINQGTKAYTLENAAQDGSLTVEKDGKKVGKYTIDAQSGEVTFTPEKDFKGAEAPAATVKLTVTFVNDAQGTPIVATATATYTPTVVPVEPKGENAKSSDIQGAEQTGKPTFAPGTVEVENNGVKETKGVSLKDDSYKLLDKDGVEVADGAKTPAYADGENNPDGTPKQVGTYSIDKDTGVVTFTPTDKSYSGKVKPVTVQAQDNNDSKATATYTPEIVPVKPEAKDSATSGKQGKKQTSKIIFDTEDTDITTLNFNKGKTTQVLTPAGEAKSVELDPDTISLVNADGEKVNSVTVYEDNGTTEQGIYTFDKATNTITFQPTADFVGTAKPVTIQITDLNGSVATATYTPTVVEEDGSVVVKYVDENDKPLVTAETLVDSKKVGTEYTAVPKEFEGYELESVVAPEGTTTADDKKVTGKVADKLAEVVYKYKKVEQKATLTFVDNTTGVEREVDATKVLSATTQTATGTAGEVIKFANKESIIADLEKAGYEVISDDQESATDSEKVFDAIKDNTQEFKVIVVERVEETDEKPTPGQPVDPTDPNSPLWPDTEAVKNIQTEKVVKRTIKYTYLTEDGAQAFDDEVQEVVFTRVVKVNLVKGTVEYGEWTSEKPGFDGAESPEIDNYTTETTVVPIKEGVTANTEDSVIHVVYKAQKPTGKDVTSTGLQGKEQEGTPTFKRSDKTDLVPSATNPAVFIDPDTNAVTQKTEVPAKDEAGKTVGKYTLEPATGKVTFVPNKDYVGTPQPAKVEMADPNGEVVVANYTPTVTPVKPTGVDGFSAGPKGEVQSGKVTFVAGTPEVPMDTTKPVTFEDGTTTKEVPGVGKYEVDPDGLVTFTPEENYVGTPDAVKVIAYDVNGTKAEANYTPKVFEATVSTQVATVAYKDDKGVTLGEVDILQGESGKDIDYSTQTRLDELKKKGYELVSDEFTKEDGTKQKFDNDKDVIQKFVVTVKPRIVPLTPDAKPGQPVDPTDPNSPLWPESIKDLKVTEEVKRTISYVDSKDRELVGAPKFEDVVSFKRNIEVNLVTGNIEKTGEWTADRNTLKGNALPRVIGYIATSGDIESSTKDIIVSAEDKDIEEKVVYTKLGAWIPEVPGVNLEDAPLITYPNHPTDPTKVGELPPGVIPYVPGYTPVVNGEKLTPVKDPQGNIIGYNPPILPTNKGENTPIKYEKDETLTTDVVTTYVDEKQQPIAPSEKGKKEAKLIAGYEYDRTEVDEKGNVKHIYKKVSIPTTDVVTTYVDEKENPIAPQEKGKKEVKPIEGYEYDRTEVDEKGNVKHIYKKVATPHVEPRQQVNPAQPPKEVKPSGKMMEKKQLPNTSADSTTSNGNSVGIGLIALLAILGLRRKKENE